MKNFALIGVAGFVAPRHLKAIKDTGNCLVAAMDPHDSVGLLDSWFPDANFFVEFERFDRYLEKVRRRDARQAVHFVSICSPNYLHDAHIRFAMRSGADAICEKPVVLNPWNIDPLKEIERESGRRVYTVLQLRLHPAVIALRNRIAESPLSRRFDVDLIYITSRGKWYDYSWKADEKKSGGVATNIGVHFFDMLHFLFGKVSNTIVHYRDPRRIAGYLEYERARVRWFLSVNAGDLPRDVSRQGLRTFRSMTLDGDEFEFSDGFADLHTRVYEDILAGGGFDLETNRVAIEIVSQVRQLTPVGLTGDYHPHLQEVAS